MSDLADGLWQINEEINRRHGEILPLFDIGKWAELRQTIVDDLAAKKDDDPFPMKPQRILNDVRAFMGDEDILLSESVRIRCGSRATISARKPIPV